MQNMLKHTCRSFGRDFLGFVFPSSENQIPTKSKKICLQIVQDLQSNHDNWQYGYSRQFFGTYCFPGLFPAVLNPPLPKIHNFRLPTGSLSLTEPLYLCSGPACTPPVESHSSDSFLACSATCPVSCHQTPTWFII